MKKQWNKVVTACAFALVASVLVAADTPRSEWLGKVGDCANSAETMTATISSVSAADQVSLVAEVNAALAKMPGSNEQRAAAFVQANVAAVKAAMSQDREKHAGVKVIAEVFATVPPEYLPLVSEQLAKEALKRKGMENDRFMAVADKILKAVAARCDTAENGAVREAFAAVTMVKASGDTPTKEMVDAMLAPMGDAKARETAANEWMGPALGMNGAAQSYDPMLGAANAGDEPDHAVVDSIVAGKDAKAEVAEASDEPAVLPVAAKVGSSAEFGLAMLADLAAMNSGLQAAPGQVGAGGLLTPGALDNVGNDLYNDVSLWRTPRAYVESKNGVGGDRDGKNEDGNPYYTHGGRGEKPGSDGDNGGGGQGYRGQRLAGW